MSLIPVLGYWGGTWYYVKRKWGGGIIILRGGQQAAEMDSRQQTQADSMKEAMK